MRGMASSPCPSPRAEDNVRAFTIVLGFMIACGKPKPDVDAVNVLVDRSHDTQLRFALRYVDYKFSSKAKRRFGAVVPVGWDYNKLSEQFEAEAELGPRMSYWSSCASDPCVLGDFQSKIDADLLERSTVVRAKILKDQRDQNSRFIVTKDEIDRVVINRYWWEGDSPSEYFTCTAVIMGRLLQSQQAFEKACEVATVDSVDPD